MNPKVSILLPVRDGGAALQLAVCSLLRQTLVDWELLVLDDGSTDGCTAPVTTLRDNRIRVVSDGARRGLARRLNEGIDAVRGAFIARMDHDDIAFPERLRTQAGYLMEHPEVDLLGTRALAFGDDGRFLGMLPFRQTHQEICAAPWRGFSLPHPTWMGRAEWFRRFRYRIPEVERAEDQEMLLRAYATSRFFCLSETLLAYHVGDTPLRRVLGARLSLGQALWREHGRRGRYGYAVLGAAGCVVKAAADVAANAAGRPSPTARALQPETTADVGSDWESLFDSTKECARRLFGPPSWTPTNELAGIR